MKKGTSLVELLLYTGLLAIVLTVLYQFFALVLFQRIEAAADEAVYGSGRRILFELSQSIKGAESINSPLMGGSGSSLTLNGETVVFQVNEDQRLEKTADGETVLVSDANVIIENLNFTVLGPSLDSPTVEISFTVRYLHALEGGRRRSRDFQTAVAPRT